MKKRYLLLLSVVTLFLCFSGKKDKPAYRLYDTKGHSESYNDLLKAASQADVVFFGEIHDNPICHWLELELTKDLYTLKKGKIILGAEMFERDNQLLLNEYISKMIRKKDFEAEAKLWPNYKTDYAPVIDFAAEHGIRVIATNIPRRFAAIVNEKGMAGLDSINGLERGMVAPLPMKYNPNLKCYKDILEAMGDAAAMHSGPNIAHAQAIKDATMAASIMKNLADSNTFIHFNGSYHSDNYEGLVWYTKEYNKRNATDLKILVISSVEQDKINYLDKDNLNKGDFILCIPSTMTKTQIPSYSQPVVMPPAGKTPLIKKEVPAAKDSVEEGNDESEEDDD
ncbi:MAG: ChaN family lipoprotein [Bacteroidota bacterium]|nr:ChaN family lipoprotein [Bacteroidota bacterium]